jgi:Xaa-Pro aminopeptidase
VPTGPLVHGVGISDQELPGFDHPLEARGYPEILQAGTVMVMSNIGLTSPEGWGVRYEETFLVVEEGTEVLSADC